MNRYGFKLREERQERGPESLKILEKQLKKMYIFSEQIMLTLESLNYIHEVDICKI